MTPPQARRLQQRGEQLAASLPPLLVAAERVAATVAQGVHGRRRVGQGETFWQFRQYESGDPPQLIDWRLTAKSERVYVRELEWEAAESLWLWRDASASMAWRSDRNLPTKRDRADLLLLALIVLLVRAGEHVALFGSGRLPSTGRATLSRIALQLEREQSGEAAGNVPPDEDLPRHAQTVMVSDFLGPLEEIEGSVRSYAERGVKGHLLQILDPAEESLPYEGRVRFHGTEGEGDWLVSRVQSVREAYRRRLDLRRDELGALTRRLGWTMTHHRTDHPAQAALLALYTALSHGHEGAG